MGKLSRIDVDEILTQQEATRQKFGEIALQWGLCEPDHLCEAWCTQLAEGAERVDLNIAGIDSHATQYVGLELARKLGVVPIRSIANQIVVATSRALEAGELAELVASAGKMVRLVLADRRQIEAAIDAYYADRNHAAA
jgi:hypothetical protein